MLEKRGVQRLGLALIATVALGLATATNAEARLLGGFHAGGFHGFHAGGFRGGLRGGGFGFRGAGVGFRGRGWGWGGVGAGVVVGSALGAAGDYAYGYPSYPAYSGYGYPYPAYGYAAAGNYGAFRGGYVRRFGGATFASGHRFVGGHAGLGRIGRVHAGHLLRR